VVVQNLKKGNSEMVALLRIMSNDAWEMRRAAAKRLGEEASTKMIFPLVLMLVAILIIVAMPAVISLKNVM
jgi:tight adherence protein C